MRVVVLASSSARWSSLSNLLAGNSAIVDRDELSIGSAASECGSARKCRWHVATRGPLRVKRFSGAKGKLGYRLQSLYDGAKFSREGQAAMYGTIRTVSFSSYRQQFHREVVMTKVQRVGVVAMVVAASIARSGCADEIAVAKIDVAAQAGVEGESIEADIWAVAFRSARESEDKENGQSVSSGRGEAVPDLKTPADAEAWIRKLGEEQRLIASQHFALETMSGREATATIGAEVPRVTATSITELGRTNSVQMQPVGTAIKIIPVTADASRVVLTLVFEVTELRKSDDVMITETNDGERLPADVVNSIRFQSTFAVDNGGVTVAHQATMDATRAGESYVILVSARRVPGGVAANAR